MNFKIKKCVGGLILRISGQIFTESQFVYVKIFQKIFNDVPQTVRAWKRALTAVTAQMNFKIKKSVGGLILRISGQIFTESQFVYVKIFPEIFNEIT
jgi:hypothetical protein